MAKDSIEIIRRPESRNPLRLLFLTKVMTELSRHRYLFDVVEAFSMALLTNWGYKAVGDTSDNLLSILVY